MPKYPPISATQRARIKKRDGYKCRKCDDKDALEVDHIVAREKGGSNEDSNLITLCRSHHRNKTNRDLMDIGKVRRLEKARHAPANGVEKVKKRKIQGRKAIPSRPFQKRREI